jgi:mannosyltransferase OCH1-like enzyme
MKVSQLGVIIVFLVLGILVLDRCMYPFKYKKLNYQETYSEPTIAEIEFGKSLGIVNFRTEEPRDSPFQPVTTPNLFIFQTYENEDLPQLMADSMGTWKTQNPTWHHFFYTNETALTLVAQVAGPEGRHIFENLEIGAAKADLFRYCALFAYGGVYVDISTVCQTPLNLVLRNVNRRHPLTQAIICKDLPGSGNSFYQGFLYFKYPRHPLMRKCILEVISRLNKLPQKLTYPLSTVHNNTGPRMLHDMVNEYCKFNTFTPWKPFETNHSRYELYIGEHNHKRILFTYNREIAHTKYIGWQADRRGKHYIPLLNNGIFVKKNFVKKIEDFDTIKFNQSTHLLELFDSEKGDKTDTLNRNLFRFNSYEDLKTYDILSCKHTPLVLKYLSGLGNMFNVCHWSDKYLSDQAHRKYNKPRHSIDFFKERIPNYLLTDNTETGKTNVVYVRAGDRESSDLEVFLTEILPLIRSPFILISTDGDRKIPSNLSTPAQWGLIQTDKILKFYAQNFDGTISLDGRIQPFPIGINFHSPVETDKSKKIQYAELYQTYHDICSHTKPVWERDLSISTTYLASSNPSRGVMDSFLTKFASINPSLKVNKFKKLEFLDYLQTLTSCTFVTSPSGNGEDCHRTWEILSAGAIPIVVNSSISNVYAGLAVLELKNWSELLDLNANKLNKFLDQVRTGVLKTGRKTMQVSNWLNTFRKVYNLEVESLKTPIGRGYYFPPAFPKIIHQTFKSEKMPLGMKQARKTWADLNVGWDIKFYNDEDCANIVKNEVFTKNLYRAFQVLTAGACKADLFRVCVLYLYGGIYADISMVCKRSMESVISELPEGITLAFPTDIYNGYDSACTIYQAFLIAQPRLEYLKEVAEKLALRVLNDYKTQGNTSANDVFNMTGPKAFSEELNLSLKRKIKEPWRAFSVQAHNIYVFGHKNSPGTGLRFLYLKQYAESEEFVNCKYDGWGSDGVHKVSPHYSHGHNLFITK